MVVSEMPRWLVFSLISSLLCICGALCVPLMSTIFKGNKQTHSSNNTKLVNYGLSLSAGSMLTTSLNMMLPKIDRTNRLGVFLGVLSGVCISLSLNYVVHVYASESLVHCAHGDGEDDDHDHHLHGHSHSHDHSHSHQHTHPHTQDGHRQSLGRLNRNNSLTHSHKLSQVYDSNEPIPPQQKQDNVPTQSHQVDVNYEINCQVNHHPTMRRQSESDPLLSTNANTNTVKDTLHPSTAPENSTNNNNNNDNITLTISRKKSITMGKSLIDLLTKRHRNSIGDCCSLGECTPTIEPDELPCTRSGMISSHHLLPTLSQKSSGNTNLNTARTNHTMDTNDLETFQKTQQGIACVENMIGYDLENLSLYRKNFYFAKSNKTEADINDGLCDYGSTSESITSVNTSNSIDSHAELNAPTMESLNNDHHHHSYSNEDHDSDNLDTYDLENNITRAESYPHSSLLIRHHSLQPSHAHHHHIETPFSKLLSIGMQTCIVLTLHKFPEGFIIYYTNKNDTPDSLGFSIFLSLTIHNFVEGFAMALPLYAIFEKKWLALVITAVLGGGSQPMGALLGYLIFRNKASGDENPLQMDILLSITAGFLLVIGLQMFQTGIGFSDGHHHHQGEANEEMKMNHSSGTTCLKWCCAGVLLILASQVFK